MTEKDIQRFWDRVDKSDGENSCWLWTRGKNNKGYGVFSVTGRNRYTHRLAWILTYGEIPQNLSVCHHCDNRLCCNPNHLFTGTAKDNVQDMMRKGRNRWGKGNSKLTRIQVEEIRERFGKDGMTHRMLAREYGVAMKTIQSIVHHQRWK